MTRQRRIEGLGRIHSTDQDEQRIEFTWAGLRYCCEACKPVREPAGSGVRDHGRTPLILTPRPKNRAVACYSSVFQELDSKYVDEVATRRRSLSNRNAMLDRDGWTVDEIAGECRREGVGNEELS